MQNAAKKITIKKDFKSTEKCHEKSKAKPICHIYACVDWLKPPTE